MSGARWPELPGRPPLTGVRKIGSIHITPGRSARARWSANSAATRVSPSPSTSASQPAMRGSVRISVGIALAWWPPSITLIDGSSAAAMRALSS